MRGWSALSKYPIYDKFGILKRLILDWDFTWAIKGSEFDFQNSLKYDTETNSDTDINTIMAHKHDTGT